jgi:mannose-6-phosphate isomerase
MQSTAALSRESLVDSRLTDRFRVLRTTLTGKAKWHSHGFTILLVVEGNCTVRTDDEEIYLSQFDRIVVPCGLASLEMVTQGRAVFLECLPPEALSPEHQHF